jgi:hypothetical protein
MKLAKAMNQLTTVEPSDFGRLCRQVGRCPVQFIDLRHEDDGAADVFCMHDRDEVRNVRHTVGELLEQGWLFVLEVIPTATVIIVDHWSVS